MRVLVLGTNRMCHDRLRWSGHELVLMIQRDRVRAGDPLGPYRHTVTLESLREVDTWVRVAGAFHAGMAFEAVVAFNEHTYPLVRAISERLGIPTTVDADLYARVLDKARMREILAAHGIPSCAYELAHGPGEVRAAVQTVGFPCVVKPVDGEGSAGVAKLESTADLEPALARLGSAVARGVLVEEFLVGEEFSVEGISVGRTHHLVAVTQRFAYPHTFVSQGHVVPAPLAEPVRSAILDYVHRVLDTLGFHDCPSHTEIVLTAAGPRLVETHNRIGGDRIIDLVGLATGIDLHDLVARQAVGEDLTGVLPDSVPHRQYAANWYAAPSGPPTNVLIAVQHVEQVRELPFVHLVEVLKQPGTPQAAIREHADRSAQVIAVGESAEQAVARARDAMRRLGFVYTWTPAE